MENIIPERLRADFSERAVVDTAGLPWIPSPQAGVDRRMLDRIGGEVARATSIVRYAPDSCFSPHTHGGGEEFLVLDGIFSDEHGDYPAGSYVRNPPGSGHAPFTRDGCTIFVKLRQMRSDDETHVVIRTGSAKWIAGDSAGVTKLPLFTESDGPEQVELIRLEPGAEMPLYACNGGEEILVLSGTLKDSGGTYGPGFWIRNPTGHQQDLRSETGATYWRKQGHLPGQTPTAENG